MKNIRLIALDLDGTLLQPDQTIAPEDKKALDEARAQGIEIVVSTGRQLSHVPPQVFEALDVRYVLASNGAVGHDRKTGEKLFERAIDDRLCADVLRRILPVECISIVFIDDAFYVDESQRGIIHRMNYHPFFNTFEKLWNYENDLPSVIENGGKHVVKITMDFADDPDGTPHDRARAVEILNGVQGIQFTCGGGTNIEINRDDTDKGIGLKALCEKLGIPVEACMACGDSGNDIPLIRAAGVGIAMANASEDVRRAADYITLSNLENGVAHAVRKFAL